MLVIKSLGRNDRTADVALCFDRTVISAVALRPYRAAARMVCSRNACFKSAAACRACVSFLTLLRTGGFLSDLVCIRMCVCRSSSLCARF